VQQNHLFLYDKLDFDPLRMWLRPHEACINEMHLHHTHEQTEQHSHIRLHYTQHRVDHWVPLETESMQQKAEHVRKSANLVSYYHLSKCGRHVVKPFYMLSYILYFRLWCMLSRALWDHDNCHTCFVWADWQTMIHLVQRSASCRHWRQLEIRCRSRLGQWIKAR